MHLKWKNNMIFTTWIIFSVISPSFIPYSIEDVIFIFSLYYHNKWHNLSSNNFLEHLFTCQMINNKIGDIVFVQSFTLKIEMNGMEFKTENKENCSKIINVCLFEEWVFVITISDSIVATTINQRRYSIWLLIFTYVQQYVFINVEIYFWIPKWIASYVLCLFLDCIMHYLISISCY